MIKNVYVYLWKYISKRFSFVYQTHKLNKTLSLIAVVFILSMTGYYYVKSKSSMKRNID